MSSYRQDSRRHSSSRRDSSPSRHRRDSRRSSPGPSRARSPPSLSRSDRSLPEQFGRIVTERKDDDEGTVLQCMKRSFTYNPLGCLSKCIGTNQKLKVWTRNYKEIRGICTGYIIAFDKHWNMVLRDVDEVYMKPPKAKTPYLNDVKSGDTLPELQPKTPKQKKPASQEEDVQAPAPEVQAPAPEVQAPAPEVQAASESEEGEVIKKKKKKSKKVPKATNRFMKQCFVRGDNIVMVSILKESDPVEREDDSNSSKEA